LARKLRVFIENTPVHIILRSIDFLTLFKDKQDSDFFLQSIELLCSKLHLNIHSYTMTTTYFEFLATPADIETIPKFMQSLGRQYVLYYNKKYNRVGTLWEGRYKSSLVDASNYLFDVMCYIEQKTNYISSSKNKNLIDEKNLIVNYHEKYKELGFTQEERINQYQNILKNFDKSKSTMVESSLEQQTVTGSIEYIKAMEEKLGLVLTTKQRGRPKKQSKKEKIKMYKNLQVLDKEKHKDLKVSSLENLFFAKDLSSVSVMINETGNIGQTFPVVFTSNEESPELISIVSLGNGNLALNEEGKWIANYVPFSLRKYPFTMASVKDNKDQRVIMIDEDSSLVSKSKGKQLFKKDSSQSELLENAIKFLSDNEKYVNMTSIIVAEIAKSGILEDRDISVGEGDEKKVLVNGFKIVDKEKLNALSDDVLASWARRGILTFIDSHLKSLDNIQTLFTLLNKRQN